MIESIFSSISGVLSQVPDKDTEKAFSIGSADVGITDVLGSFDGIVDG